MRELSAILNTAIALALIITPINAVIELELRSSSANSTTGSVYQWGPQEFVGFFYDTDNDLGDETINISISENNILKANDGIIYSSTAQKKKFEYDGWGEFWTIGFLPARNTLLAMLNQKEPKKWPLFLRLF